VKEISTDGTVWQYEYDANSNRVKEINPDGTYQYEFKRNDDGSFEVVENDKVIMKVPAF
jgi:YD repeat-containing protein